MANEDTLSNKIFLFDQFTQESSEKVVKGLLEKSEAGHSEIDIYINSYGGYVTDLFAITDTIDKVRSEHGIKVNTFAVGAAMSCGALLMMYGDKRYAAKNTDILTHGVQAFSIGSAEDMKETIKEMELVNDKFAKIISQKSGMTNDKALELLKSDRYFTADEAVKNGFVDSLWEKEDEIQEITKFVEYDMAASATPKKDVVEANQFLQSLNKKYKLEGSNKKIPKTNNKENIMADGKTIESLSVELKTAQFDVRDLTAKLKDKDAEITALNDKLTAKDTEVEQFYNDRKDELIASIKKLAKSETEKAEIEKDFSDIKTLPYEKFKAFIEREASRLSASNVTTGGINLKADKDNGEEEDNLSDNEKMVADALKSKVNIDMSVANSLRGIKKGGK